jgi:hypothetical protein
VWARRDPAVTRLPLFVLWLLCAGFPPVSAAAVPSWQNERPIPQAFGSGARVAITSAGDVAVAWQDVEQGVSVAVRPARGHFGAPQRLSGAGRWVKGLDVVADSRGALIVVWADGECCRADFADTRVWASTREPGGRFSQPVALSRGFDGSYIRAPAVAAGDDGSLTVAWPVDNNAPPAGGVTEWAIEAADRLPGGGFGAPTLVSPPDVKASEPRVARGPSGETVVLWNSLACPPCSYELFASTRPPGGEFGAPELIAAPGQSGGLQRWLAASQVQIASDGTVVAVWTEGVSCMYCSGAAVKAARRRPGQRFESPQTLGHVGGSGPWLALDPAGSAFALWGDANTDRDALSRNPRVFGAEAPPHSPFGRARALERGGDALGIAIGGGHAIAAWTANGRIVAGVQRQGGYCRAPISRRPAKPDGDIAANQRGDAVAVWGPAKYPANVIVAMGPADGSSPVIRRLSVRLGDFGVTGAGVPRRAVRPQFRFVLSEAAQVRISVARFAGGRFRPVSSLVRSMPAGKNRVTYSRPGHGLRPGRYRARISARDCGGRNSKWKTVPFVLSG